MIKKSAIVDSATVDAQDARVGKMMKLGTWFSEGSLGIEQQQTASVQLFNSMLDCRRSESRRRLGSAIDDRGVPGVMTEIVTRCRTS